MDRRQKKTREAIFHAFTALLAKKSYHQITVQDILDRADVGRTTFYAHFETKDYLLKALCEELFGHVLGIPREQDHYADCENTEGVFLHLLRHLQETEKFHAPRRLFGQSHLRRLCGNGELVARPRDAGKPRNGECLLHGRHRPHSPGQGMTEKTKAGRMKSCRLFVR